MLINQTKTKAKEMKKLETVVKNKGTPTARVAS
jgi:hypothetical protein